MKIWKESREILQEHRVPARLVLFVEKRKKQKYVRLILMKAVVNFVQ